jgi:hypothetical protein
MFTTVLSQAEPNNPFNAHISLGFIDADATRGIALAWGGDTFG